MYAPMRKKLAVYKKKAVENGISAASKVAESYMRFNMSAEYTCDLQAYQAALVKGQKETETE